MSNSLSLEYATQLFDRLKALQEEIGDIPESFSDLAKKKKEMLSEAIDKLGDDYTGEQFEEVYYNLPIIRPEGAGFDINRFLEVLDKIKLKKNQILDYAYGFDYPDAEPLVYTRNRDEKKVTFYNYKETFGYGDVKPYLKDIIIEKDPESFYQLVVFSFVVNQFYQQWHAQYNDHTFIYNPDKLEQVLNSIPDDRKDTISDESREQLKKLSFNPVIDILDNRVECRCLLFSKWIGFYYNKALISYPELSIENEREVVVSYSCGYEY